MRKTFLLFALIPLMLMVFSMTVFAQSSSNVSISSNNGGQICSQDAKQCPNGSYVTRTGPNCAFADCVVGLKFCSQEAKRCPNGSYVTRTGPNCAFSPCPVIKKICSQDAKRCPNGSYVTRTGPNCTFSPCHR